MSIRMSGRRWIAAGAVALAVAGGSGIALAQQGGGSDTGERSDAVAEKAEAARLAPSATVTRAQAQRTALGAVPGTVVEAQLGDEDGTVVWEVEVRGTDGSGHEVQVDAKTGAVVSNAADELD